MPEAWTTVVPEGPEAIDSFNIVGDKIYVKRLKDVKTETRRTRWTANPPARSSSRALARPACPMGRSTDRYGFFSFESYITPPTIYRVDTKDR